MHRFDIATIPHTPWKNGGGTTREIVCWPPGSSMAEFGWRVSVAGIAQSGPFSAFAGVERVIMLLGGDGVQLSAWDGSVQHRLDTRWQPFAFSGDTPLDCTLLGGASSDFNLMLRRGEWAAEIEVIQHHTVHVGEGVGEGDAGLCMVLGGQWRDARDRVYSAGQGLWWSSSASPASLNSPTSPAPPAPPTSQAPLLLAPLPRTPVEEPALVCIRLQSTALSDFE